MNGKEFKIVRDAIARAWARDEDGVTRCIDRLEALLHKGESITTQMQEMQKQIDRQNAFIMNNGMYDKFVMGLKDLA